MSGTSGCDPESFVRSFDQSGRSPMAAGIKLEFDLFIISPVWNYLVVIRERSDRITGERSSPLSHSFLLSFFLSLSYLEMSTRPIAKTPLKRREFAIRVTQAPQLHFASARVTKQFDKGHAAIADGSRRVLIRGCNEALPGMW